ncbi:hypothetical protein ABZT17_21240 [Streptomyces sp. NPDC005648]|uniref:hypothetical protein n=1 Tax=Streptomyces sp. NPDC005648 TaxID=3157044 RepID=UPI0033B8A52C
MASGPNDFNLTISLDSLFCFQGDDIDNVMGPESEPYLWVIMMKIDGELLFQQGNQLVGTPSFFFSWGSHGDIGGPILQGSRPIPASIGQWTTSMNPIPISLAGQELTQIPGVIICAGVLLEENMTPDEAVEKAHFSTEDLITRTAKSVIDSLGLAGFAADTAAEVALTNHSISQAASDVLNRRMKPVYDLFEVAAPAAAAVTVLENLDLGGFIGTAIDRDKPMGTFSRTFGQAELAGTREYTPGKGDGQSIEINEKIWNMPEWAYTVHGRAWAHHRLVRKGFPVGHRLKVSCSSKRFTSSMQSRVSGIGGVEGETRWYLTREEAANAILEGKHSFYVEGDDGRELEVRAVQGGYRSGRPWYYVQTDTDSKVSNNLLGMPSCPPGPMDEFWY